MVKTQRSFYKKSIIGNFENVKLSDSKQDVDKSILVVGDKLIREFSDKSLDCIKDRKLSGKGPVISHTGYGISLIAGSQTERYNGQRESFQISGIKRP